TVEVDGQGYRGHSWAQSLTDAQGARYTKVNATPPPGAKLFARQLALVDIHEGQGSKRLNPAEQTFKTKLPTGISPGASYVFDVFRVAGGSSHAYCFHAMVDDEFRWNATGEKPVPHIPADGKNLANDEGYLSIFELSDNFAATPPDSLQATW